MLTLDDRAGASEADYTENNVIDDDDAKGKE